MNNTTVTKKKRTTDAMPAATEFAEVINLMALYSDSANRLAEIEVKANEELLAILDEERAEYAKLQEAMRKAVEAMEAVCRSHPEWFTNAKSIKTPYGKVLMHASSSLEVTNDEATIRLLKAEARSNPEFPAGDYIHQVEKPNLEALEGLSDADLERFMVKRVKKDNFSVTPAKVDFGKAVEKAAN